MGVFDTIKETLNGIFAVSGDGWVRRKSRSKLDIEILNGEASKDDITGSCELCVALNKTVFKNNNKPEYYHYNCKCKNEPYNLTEVELDFPMRKIDSYLFKKAQKRAMMLSIGYNDSDHQEVYDLVEENIKTEFLNGNYKLQILNKHGQHITINFTINGKRAKEGSVYNCHAGCVVWPNGKIKVATPVILDKEIK